eukprot:gene21043-25252_t
MNNLGQRLSENQRTVKLALSFSLLVVFLLGTLAFELPRPPNVVMALELSTATKRDKLINSFETAMPVTNVSGTINVVQASRVPSAELSETFDVNVSAMAMPVTNVSGTINVVQASRVPFAELYETFDVNCTEGLACNRIEPENRSDKFDAPRKDSRRQTFLDVLCRFHTVDHAGKRVKSERCGMAGGEEGPAVRPLVYVYELPARFTTWPMGWSNSQRGDFDRPIGHGILERLLSSRHRTAVPEKADYFFVPVVGMRAVRRLAAMEYIRARWPFWNMSTTPNHIWVGTDDLGASNYFSPGRPPPEEFSKKSIFLQVGNDLSAIGSKWRCSS